jgi:hypothetical protein
MNQGYKMRLLLRIVFCSILVSSSFGQETPKTMMKISTRLVSARVESGAFATQLKTTWRSGTRYARIAEAPDRQNHIHGLIVINEPDVWMINLFDKSGQHIVDPGPSLDAHIPIFQVSGKAKRELDALELGKELEFFTGNGAKQSAGEVINGKATDRYDATLVEAN